MLLLLLLSHFSRVWLCVTPWTPWNSTGQNIGVDSLSLLQGIFLTHGSNPGLPICRWILYQLSHNGRPRVLDWVAYPFSSRSSQPKNWTRVSCIAGGYFMNWAIRKAHIFNGLTHSLSNKCFMCACEEYIIHFSWMSVSGYLLGLITLLLLVIQVLTNLLIYLFFFSIHY